MAKVGEEMVASPELGEDVFTRMEAASGKNLAALIVVTIEEDAETYGVWGMGKLGESVGGMVPDKAVEVLLMVADNIRTATT